ncbi:MAG: Hsp20/alpha crystallin family protein, partial [Eubacteriales bacterium]|nr:Hsp20/alpha crystallin family protein [Eubacteriales bacterium]
MAGLVPFNRKSNALSTNFDDMYRNMLDDFFALDWPLRRGLAADTFKVDVREDDTAYTVEAELPGVKKEDIDIQMDDGRLRIAVNSAQETEQRDKNYIHKERRYASMSRHIYLENAQAQDVKAKLADGVLCIS